MTSSDGYPRDLIGYAGQPPHPRWPNDAKVAVSFVLNYEEGGENCVLHGDAHSESVLTDVGGDPLPGARNLNIESNFEYGSRVGFWEILRLLQEYRIDATVYAVGMALERNPVAAAAIAASGFEVACHGQRWIDYQYVPESTERADMQRNVDVITRMIGRRPLGWYTGRPGPNTRRLVVETGGFLYDSDAYNDDLPYLDPDRRKPPFSHSTQLRRERQPPPAGRRFQHRPGVLQLLQGCVRLALPQGRAGRTAHDDHQSAHPHHRAAGPHRGPGQTARLYLRPQVRVDL